MIYRCQYLRASVCTLSIAVLAAAFPFGAAADYAVYPDSGESPGVGSYVTSSRSLSVRSEEEWAALEDDTLLYDEIADLIHEYSPAVVIGRDELAKDERRSMDARDISEYLLDQADEYDAQADAVEAASATLAATYRAQAVSLRSEAESALYDFDEIKLDYEETEHELALAARETFVDYRLYEKKLEFQDYYIGYLGTLLDSARTRLSVGTATETEVLEAEEALLSARAERVSLEAAGESAYMGLIVSCGWSYDASPLIGELPALDIDALRAIDRAADEEAARAGNISIKKDEIELANALEIGGDSLEAAARQELATTQDSFGIGFRAAFDTLTLATDSYELSVRALSDGESSYQALSRRYGEGLASMSELRAGEYSLRQLALAKEEAYCELVKAYAVYEAAVADGVL